MAYTNLNQVTLFSGLNSTNTEMQCFKLKQWNKTKKLPDLKAQENLCYELLNFVLHIILDILKNNLLRAPTHFL